MEKNEYIEDLMLKAHEGNEIPNDIGTLFLYNNYAKSMECETNGMVIFNQISKRYIEETKLALNKANINTIKCAGNLDLRYIEMMDENGFKLKSFEKVKCNKSPGMFVMNSISCLVFDIVM